MNKANAIKSGMTLPALSVIFIFFFLGWGVPLFILFEFSVKSSVIAVVSIIIGIGVSVLLAGVLIKLFCIFRFYYKIDHNIIELIRRHRLLKNKTWKFDISEILSYSVHQYLTSLTLKVDLRNGQSIKITNNDNSQKYLRELVDQIKELSNTYNKTTILDKIKEVLEPNFYSTNKAMIAGYIMLVLYIAGFVVILNQPNPKYSLLVMFTGIVISHWAFVLNARSKK